MDELKVVGKSVIRKDAADKVTGSTMYIADLTMANQLYGAVYRSPVPHGIIKKIDVSKAREYPGVRAVVTDKDVPYRFGRTLVDQTYLARDKVRMEGEPIVAVAADTLEIAREAVGLIDVEIEPLPVVEDMMEALKPGSPLVHDDLETYKNNGKHRCKSGTNIYDHFMLRKGDVEKGFAEADVIVENEYECAMLSHSPIETHGAIARVDGSGKVTVWTPGQSPFYLRTEIASSLGIPESRVRIISPPIGGGFGGKLEMRAEQLALALALHTKGKPVKVIFTRHEDYIAGVVRAGVRFKLKTGAKKDGTITAFEAVDYWDTGAYATVGPVVTTKANVILAGPYNIENVKTDGYCIATNKQLGTAQRGFGVSEAAYAHEQQMDALAQALDMDPLELRLKNIMVDGSKGHTGENLFTVGVKECLEAAAAGLEWNKKPLSWVTEDGKIRGKGLGAFMKYTGTPSFSSATVKLNHDGSVIVSYGTTEMGQGVGTVIPQMVSEELGIDYEKVSTVTVDTDNVPLDKTTTSSRSTFHMGNAVLKAVDDLKRQLRELAAYAWKTDLENIRIDKSRVYMSSESGGKEEHSVDMKDLKKSGLLKAGQPIVGFGSYETSRIWDPPDPETFQSERLTAMWFFGANAAEVEIDPDTGKVRVISLSAGHDVGKAINPLNCYQQIEGGVMMGIGNTMLEEFIHRDGILKNGNMVDFKIPTSMDVDTEVIINLVEKPHPEGPYGAKGIGEPAMCAVQASVASAVGHALGISVTKVPIKPETVIEAARKRLEENNAS